MYDPSQRGADGIDAEAVLRFPELSVNPLVPSVLQLFVNDKTNRVHPEQFLNFCAALSSRMPANAKKIRKYPVFVWINSWRRVF